MVQRGGRKVVYEVSRSSLTLEPDTAADLEGLPAQIQSHSEAIKDVLADGTWTIPTDLAYRFADSLLTLSEHSSKAQALRQAAVTYVALARDVLRAAELRTGYASLADDAELAEVRATMAARSKGRTASHVE